MIKSNQNYLKNVSPLFLVAIFFRLALEFSYTDFVSPIFSYAGLIISENQEKYFESWIVYLTMLALVPSAARKPSDILVGLAFFVYITPLLVFYALANQSQISLYLVLTQFVIMDVVRRTRFFSIPSLKNGYTIAKGLSIIGVVVATVWMVATVGFSSFNLDDAAVYDFRDDANNAIYTGAMGYLTVWATNICSPILLLIFLRKKKYHWVVGMVFIHVIWFGISTHKSVLFYPLLVILIYYFFKNLRATAIIPAGFLMIIGLALASFFLAENILLASLFVRRVFFVPSHLTFTYLDFFDNNPFVYWSNSFLSGLIKYPYEESIALVIGAHLGDETLWANNSFFSTGFMHAGIFGVMIYGILSGLILSVIDCYWRRGLSIHIILSVVIVPFYNLYTSADLTTSLLTHGLGFAIFVLSLLSEAGFKKLNSAKIPHDGCPANARSVIGPL